MLWGAVPIGVSMLVVQLSTLATVYPGSWLQLHYHPWSDTHEFIGLADVCGICFGLGLLQLP